jgi:MFS family permease
MTGVAIGIWVFSETGDAAPLLIAAFFAELPEMAGGIFTGFLADKWDRRLVIILGDAGQAIATILLLFTISTGIFQLWHLYLTMLIKGIFTIIQEPAASASITMLVPETHLDRANGIKQIGFPLAGAIAPALAGIIYGFAGLQAVIAFDLLTFIIAVIVVYNLNIPMPEQSAEGHEASESVWTEMLAGWNFLRKRTVLLGVVIYLSFLYFLMNGPLGMTIPYFSSYTDHEAVVGILLSMFSFGAFAGALSIAIFSSIKNRMRLILISYLLHGIFMMAFGLTRNLWLFGFVVFAMMFPLPPAGALFSTILQTKTPPDMQGRIFAITSQMFTLTTPFSFLITAYLVDNILEPALRSDSRHAVSPFVGASAGSGMGLLLLIVGAIITLTTFAMMLIPAVRNLEDNLPTYRLSDNIV